MQWEYGKLVVRVGGGESDDPHTGSQCGAQARVRIFECDTGVRLDAQVLGGHQKNFRVGFPLGYFLCSDDHIKVFTDAQCFQGEVDIPAISRRGQSDFDACLPQG
jgi:hypothetical protein